MNNYTNYLNTLKTIRLSIKMFSDKLPYKQVDIQDRLHELFIKKQKSKPTRPNRL